MLKRMMPLLVLALVMTVASPAMAACLRCAPPQQNCVPTLTTGYTICEWDTFENTCYRQNPCSVGGFAPYEPLSAEFTVASVERLDEPQPAASEPRVASLTTHPATR
jgi:hypothetical protein